MFSILCVPCQYFERNHQDKHLVAHFYFRQMSLQHCSSRGQQGRREGALDTRGAIYCFVPSNMAAFFMDPHTHLVFLSSTAVSVVSAQREWTTEEVGVCCASNLKHGGEASRSRLSPLWATAAARYRAAVWASSGQPPAVDPQSEASWDSAVADPAPEKETRTSDSLWAGGRCEKHLSPLLHRQKSKTDKTSERLRRVNRWQVPGEVTAARETVRQSRLQFCFVFSVCGFRLSRRVVTVAAVWRRRRGRAEVTRREGNKHPRQVFGKRRRTNTRFPR